MAFRFAVTTMPIIRFIVGFESLILLLQVAVNYCYVCYELININDHEISNENEQYYLIS